MNSHESGDAYGLGKHLTKNEDKITRTLPNPYKADTRSETSNTRLGCPDSCQIKIRMHTGAGGI
jgi:hypothetical protein